MVSRGSGARGHDLVRGTAVMSNVDKPDRRGGEGEGILTIPGRCATRCKPLIAGGLACALRAQAVLRSAPPVR